MNAHGKVTTEWNDDLLIVIAIGPFNELGAEISVNKIRSAIIEQNKNRWAKLEMWDEDTLGSPCVVALIKEASQWYQANGCFASAVVISNSVQKQLIEKMTNKRTKTFHDKTKAIAWLNSQRS